MYVSIPALLLFNLAAVVVLAEKGNGRVEIDEVNELSIREMRNSSRLLRKKKNIEAVLLPFHAIVAEEVMAGEGGGSGRNRYWKGQDYGHELTGKGKGSKGSKSSKSSKSNKSDKCQDGSSSSSSSSSSWSNSSSGKGGKGSGSGSNDEPTQLPTCSPSPTTTTGPSSRPTVSPAVTPSPGPTISPSPTKSPTPMPSKTPSSAPSGFPSIAFDLQLCESYSRQWILDLTDSCDEFFENCSCPDAKRLIDEGKIQCGGESQCPPDCETCSYCLIDVLECYEEEEPQPTPKPSPEPSLSPTTKVPTKTPTSLPSSEPTWQPTKLPTKTPTKTPSVSPSVGPTPEPSSVPSSEPSSLFDLQECGTYATQWEKDLVNSCDGVISQDNESCVCTDAQARIDSGQVECNGNADCPEDCEVCQFCLYNIIGCPWKNNPAPSSPPSKEGSDEPSATPSANPTPVRSVDPTYHPTSVPSQALSAPPSSTPPYDLDDCAAYDSLWRFDVIVNGQCLLAIALVEEGKITCDSVCPTDCVMCNFCLPNILDCSDQPSPSPSPTMAFDLSNCDSYADRWLQEVVGTGTCDEAITRAAAGEIGCREEECPVGCDICEVCLSMVPCPDTPPPSSRPTSYDPTISPRPSLIPTPAPTIPFALDDCSSYSKKWLLDLSATCGKMSGFDPDAVGPSTNSCQAIDAEHKISKELITCGKDVCPANCSICTFCLYDLLGCMPTQARTRRKNGN